MTQQQDHVQALSKVEELKNGVAQGMPRDQAEAPKLPSDDSFKKFRDYIIEWNDHFTQCVENGGDIKGMIAYSFYKFKKCALLNSNPNIPPDEFLKKCERLIQAKEWRECQNMAEERIKDWENKIISRFSKDIGINLDQEIRKSIDEAQKKVLWKEILKDSAVNTLSLLFLFLVLSLIQYLGVVEPISTWWNKQHFQSAEKTETADKNLPHPATVR